MLQIVSAGGFLLHAGCAGSAGSSPASEFSGHCRSQARSGPKMLCRILVTVNLRVISKLT
jgi:hypothetical protein